MKNNRRLISFFIFLFVFGFAAIFGSTAAAGTTPSNQGVWGTVQWKFDDSTGALTFTSGGTLSSKDVENNNWWRGRGDKIKTIEFQQEIVLPDNANNLLAYLPELEQVIGLDKLDFSAVTKAAGVFYYAKKLKRIDGVENWDVSHVEDMAGMFLDCTALENIDPVRNWDTRNVKNLRVMFDGDENLKSLDALANWNTSSVTDMGSMCYYCQSITNVNGLANWDTGKVTSLSSTFNQCTSLEDISGLTNWNTENVTDMRWLLYYCEYINNVDALTNWKTSNVTQMGSLFADCHRLLNITGLTNWDTHNVTDMGRLFFDNFFLMDVDALANWDTGKVEDMNLLLGRCVRLRNINGLKNWKTSNVKTLKFMLVEDGTYTNGGFTEVDALTNWDTSKVENMRGIFRDCSHLERVNLGSWSNQSLIPIDSYDGIATLTDLFENCSSLKSITLGKDFKLGKDFGDPNLPAINADNHYTGEWIGHKTKHIYASSSDFMNQYDGSIPDTYVWRRVAHKIDFQFVSGTADKTLPAAVMNLLPAPITAEEDTTASPELSATEVADGDGVWTFSGWDKKEVTNPESDETVTGTWVYTVKPKMYSVTYHSNYPKVVSTTRQLSDPNEMRLVLHRPPLHMHHIVDPNSSELGFKDEGYKFTKWSTTRDGSGKCYVVGDMLKVDCEIDLYAQWEKVEAVTDPSHEEPGNSSGPTDTSTPPETSSSTDPSTDNPKPSTSTTPPSSKPTDSKPRFSVPFSNLITAGGAASSKTAKAAKRLPATGERDRTSAWKALGGILLLFAICFSIIKIRNKAR